MRQDEEQPFFQMSGVSKSYGGAVALDRADLAVRKGRIHAILGENGAGKSTLLRVLAGLLQPTLGTVRALNRSPRGRGIRTWNGVTVNAIVMVVIRGVIPVGEIVDVIVVNVKGSGVHAIDGRRNNQGMIDVINVVVIHLMKVIIQKSLLHTHVHHVII